MATVRGVAVVPGHRSAGQLLEVATPDAFAPASKPRNDQPRVLQDMIDTGYRHDKRLEHQTVHQTQGIGVALATDEPARFMPERTIACTRRALMNGNSVNYLILNDQVCSCSA